MFKSLDPADVAGNLYNVIMITLIVIIGVNFAKFAMAKYPIRGLAGLVWNV